MRYNHGRPCARTWCDHDIGCATKSSLIKLGYMQGKQALIMIDHDLGHFF